MIDFSPIEFSLRASDFEVPGAQGIDIELMIAEEIDYAEFCVDRRFAALSEATRFIIDRLFNGDIDEALYSAHRRLSWKLPCQSNWVIELNAIHAAQWS